MQHYYVDSKEPGHMQFFALKFFLLLMFLSMWAIGRWIVLLFMQTTHCITLQPSQTDFVSWTCCYNVITCSWFQNFSSLGPHNLNCVSIDPIVWYPANMLIIQNNSTKHLRCFLRYWTASAIGRSFRLPSANMLPSTYITCAQRPTEHGCAYKKTLIDPNGLVKH